MPLLSDEYQFTMAYSHFQSRKHNERAVYEIFYRVNPFEGEVNRENIYIFTNYSS